MNYDVKISFSCRADDKQKLEQKLGSIILYNIYESIPYINDDGATLTIEKEKTK